MNPEYSALGEPDYISEDDEMKKPVFSAVTLGCGGSLILEFTKVRLVDVPARTFMCLKSVPLWNQPSLRSAKTVQLDQYRENSGRKGFRGYPPYARPATSSGLYD